MSRIKVIIIVMLAFLLVASIPSGIWAFRYFTAEVKGRVGAAEQIESAEFRIFSYEHFYDLCAEIQTAQARYEQFNSVLEQIPIGTPEYIKQLNIVAAQAAHIEKLANDYNADVDKEGTRGQFKANDLSNHIDSQEALEQAKKGERRECGN